MRKPTIKLSELANEPFGCCSNWQVCELGQKPCAYLEDDPAYAALCACHKRYQFKQSQLDNQAEVRLPVTGKEEKLDQFYSFDSNGQGMLF